MDTQRPDIERVLDRLQAHLPGLRQDMARVFPGMDAGSAPPMQDRAARAAADEPGKDADPR
jgi:hypothetical protein